MTRRPYHWIATELGKDGQSSPTFFGYFLSSNHPVTPGTPCFRRTVSGVLRESRNIDMMSRSTCNI